MQRELGKAKRSGKQKNEKKKKVVNKKSKQTKKVVKQKSKQTQKKKGRGTRTIFMELKRIWRR